MCCRCLGIEMKKVLTSAFVIFAYIQVFVHGQLYDGDVCTLGNTNNKGTCKLLSKCSSAKADIKKGIYPSLCGFEGNDVIVCCPPSVVATRQPGEIANKMCQKYSQYVWTEERSPTLLIDAPNIRKQECPFNVQQLVVGGDPATRREFPHMVQLGFEDVPIKWTCGGSLISDQYVLTAAHCLEDTYLGLALYARMGMVDLNDPDHVQIFNISERIAHPKYNPPSHYHDIGLIKLNRKASLSTYVRPACLYTKNTSPWSNVIATGWGFTQFASATQSSRLLRVILELYNFDKCSKTFKQKTGSAELMEGIKDELMICAGHSKDLKDTCQGDSGGPLQVYRNTEDKNMSCMYDIIGITSFGMGCALAVNIPGIYTRVSNYLQWIEDIVWPTN